MKKENDDYKIYRNMVIFMLCVFVLAGFAGWHDQKTISERNDVCEAQLLWEAKGTLNSELVGCTSYKTNFIAKEYIKCNCKVLEQINNTKVYAFNDIEFSILVEEEMD